MDTNYFKGRTLVLATKHNKEEAMKPILEKELGVRVCIPTGLDTDNFGTFTNEIKRSGTQLEAARKKALAGMEYLGFDLAISSEGSFGAHPECGWIQSNLELVLLLDTKNNIEIKGHYRSQQTNASGVYVSTYLEAKNAVSTWGFPQHGVVIRRREKSKPIYKGINTFKELEEEIKKVSGVLFSKNFFIETDLRAHMNPTRMNNIKLATEDLIKNIKSLCPTCACPGFSIVDVKKGLPCSQCKIQTESIIFYIYRCQKCKYEQEIPRPDGFNFADPGECNYCNP